MMTDLELRAAQLATLRSELDLLRDSKYCCNSWDAVKDDPSAYGEHFDFKVEPYDDRHTIVTADSEAALQWCYKHLGWCDRVDAFGFKVEAGIDSHFIYQLISSMARDKLVSLDDSLAEVNEQAVQWE